MAEEQTVKSRRDTHIERLKNRYPEKKFEDEEEIYGTISDDYDQYEQENADLKKENEEYRGREQKLSDMFAADQRSAQFLTDMYHGQDPVVGLVRNFGFEIRDYLDDPEMQDKLAEANKEYIDRVAASNALKEEWDANEEETKETLREFQKDYGLSDDQIDAIFAKALQIVTDGVKFKYTRETLEMVSKAMNYDADIAAAAEEGEIAGRNAKITEQLKKPQQGDGTAPLGGTNGYSGEKRPKTIFDWANEA